MILLFIESQKLHCTLFYNWYTDEFIDDSNQDYPKDFFKNKEYRCFKKVIIHQNFTKLYIHCNFDILNETSPFNFDKII